MDEIQIDEKQSVLWLLAAMGGLIGFAVGASAITLFECLYFSFGW